MFRKLILTAALVTGTVAGFTASPATAVAQPPGGHHTRYVVLVRHHFGHWERYETFPDYHDARRVQMHLERQGRIARIEIIYGGW
ncbi:MAG TPA: hypothetical protein VH092_28430 [Urbifossiella sp.]|jgi:hypothetical protein|nr:hypothetical protein [Urbifossiella sp.]